MCSSLTATVKGTSGQFEREWVFRHVLVQEVVYEALSSVVRRDLHLKVGKIMMNRIREGSSDPPAEVARHLDLGGNTRDAGTFFLQAATEAAAAFANREALDLYDRALTHCTDPEQRYAIHAGQERAHAQLGMHAEQAGDLEALALLAGDDPRRRADLHNRESLLLLRLGELYRALTAAEQAEDAATRAGDELARGEALLLGSEAYARLNDHARAMDAVTRALLVFEAQGAVPNQIRARIGLGRICLLQARHDDAFAHFAPALTLIEQTEDRWQERVMRYNLAVVHHCRGDFTRALEEGIYGLGLCEQFGDHARKGDTASVLIDTLWDLNYTRAMLDAMGPLTKAAPIKSIVNTHADGDHWWGNELVAGAEIIATADCRSEMAAVLPRARLVAKVSGRKL